MNLERKGLLVVGVPLAMQFAIVLGLVLAIWQAQKSSDDAAQGTELISEINATSNAFARILDESSALTFSTVPGKQLSFPDLPTLNESVDKLADKLAQSPDEVNNAHKLAQLKDRFISDAKTLVATANSTDALVNASTNLQGFKLLFDVRHVFDLTNKILLLENQKQTLRQNDRDNRLWIRVVMVIALLASSIAAVFLAIFSSKTISVPLSRITDNAKRIAKRQRLHSRLQGRDELVQLDGILHQVDSSIEEALTAERNLILHAADMVITLDSDATIISANPAVSEKLKKPANALFEKSLYTLIPDSERSTTEDILKECKSTAETCTFDVTLTNEQDEPLETSWTVTWSEPDGNYFCVAHDITEQNEVERLKQQFIAMISDDLKAPLSSVLDALVGLQNGEPGSIPTQMDRELSNVRKSLTHLVELLTDLLDFENLQAGKLQFDRANVSTAEIFDQSLHLVQALAKSKHVRIEHHSTDRMIYVDQRKFVELLVNILSNALKHSPNDSLIVIKMRDVEPNLLELSVHDQGPGVPDEYKQKIFAPFEQINERSTAALGTGLGLAICKLIAEGHGGEIGVRDSGELSGSAFWITIPKN